MSVNLMNLPSCTCGNGFARDYVKYRGSFIFEKSLDLREAIIETMYSGNVPVKIAFRDDHLTLESKYKHVRIKVVDGYNLNPDIIYPDSYLLSLPAMPIIKSYANDLLFAAIEYIDFLREYNLKWHFDNMIFVYGVPNLENAFWNQHYMVFGLTKESRPLTSLAIVGHELTHGLIESICGLNYKGHSGAINESYADIFGFMFENYVHHKFSMFRERLGEECFGTPLRNLADPLSCEQPDRIGGTYYIHQSDPQDHGGVHINSGIPNYIFWRLQEKIDKKEVFEIFIRVMYHLLKYSDLYHFAYLLKKYIHKDLHYIIDYSIVNS